MSKTILLVVSVLCFSVSVFAQKTKSPVLSEKIVTAIEQNLPGWTFSQYPKLLPYGIAENPVFTLQIKDDQNRSATVTVNFMESAEAKESRFRQYFIRAIMPPDSSKIENHVEKGFMVGTANSVDVLFSKANLMIDIDAKFPWNPKTRKVPPYYLPAPPEEKARILKLIEVIAGTIDSGVSLEECGNTFFRYRAANETPENKLLVAAAGGDADEVSELLRQNVNPNARITKDMDFGRVADNSGNTALHFAARQGCVETVSALIAAKADVNAVNTRSETPLMFAAYFAKAEAARRLIAAHADIHAESPDRSAAFYAVRANEVLTVVDSGTAARTQKRAENARAILQALAAQGLDFKKKEKWTGNTLLTSLLSGARGKFAAPLAQTLLDYGVDPNEPNNEGETPLLILASKISEDSAALMKLLISKGADVNKPDKNNRPPLRVLLGKQAELKGSAEYSKYINEAIAVLVNAGAKE